MKFGPLLFILSLSSAKASAAINFIEQVEQSKKAVVESEEKQRQIMSAIFQSNQRLKSLVSERSKTDQARMVVENSVRSLAEVILDLEGRVKEQRSLLRTRMNAIYRMGGQGLLRILLSSKSSAEIERNLKILGGIAKSDLDLMKDHTQSIQELSIKQKKFLSKLETLKKTQNQIRSQEKRIAQESGSKAKLLDSIRKKKSRALASLNKIREKHKGLVSKDDELLDLLLRPSFFEKKGFISEPVNGKVVRKFGLWKDPQFNVSLNHKGLYYETANGTGVQAIFPARVAFVGEVEGFGPTMILDHGDHYYSVYGGLQQTLFQEGHEVREGQMIAVVNSNLYFEIRHFSEPYDPMQWMKGSSQ